MPPINTFRKYRWQTYNWARYGPVYDPSKFSAFTITQVTATTALVSIVPTLTGTWQVMFGTRQGAYDLTSPVAACQATIGTSVTLLNLRPNTPYFARVVLDGTAPNPVGLPISGVFTGDEQTFSTPSSTSSSVPPNLVSPQSADPSAGGGEVDFQIGTDVPCTGSIDYGLTTAYGSNAAFTAGDGTTGNRFTLTITGLVTGDTYHWRARVTGKNPPNNVETVGPDHTVVAQ